MEVVDGFCIKSKIKTAILLSFYCDDAVFPSSFYKACFECEYGIYVHHTITILLDGDWQLLQQATVSRSPNLISHGHKMQWTSDSERASLDWLDGH